MSGDADRAEHGPSPAPGPLDARDDRGSPARLVAFTVLAGLVVAAASILPYAGVGLVALAPLLRRSGAMLGRARAVVPALALVLGSPMLLMMPLVMMTDPVVESLWRCGTAQMSGIVVMPLMALVAGLVAAGFALVLDAFLGRVVEAAARWVRAALLVVSVGLVVLGLVRIARFPQPEDWARTLPVAARSDGLETARLGTCREGCDLPPIPFAVGETTRTLLLACQADHCTLRLGDGDGHTLGSAVGAEGAATPGAPVEVRTHEALAVAIVTQRDRPVIAFDVHRGEAVDVGLRDVAREVAPSALAVIAMAFAVVIAVERTRRAYGERAAVKRLLAGGGAHVDDDGIVQPDDGGDAFRPPGPTLAAGPAVILARPASDAYRSGADRGTWVLAGTRASHVAAHRRRAAVFDWEAVAALSAAGAPLFAAALRGLIL